MIGKTEQEIMQDWKGDVTVPLVSICTITYKHEKYIAEALDSFLMQETNFPFEIIVDDDFSPDNTSEVIQRYVEKYPNIINARLRNKNVGMMINITKNMERATGEYIALCEGDDYWTDPTKLQIQIDEMKKYPNINLSFHSVNELIDGVKGNILSNYSDNNKIFTVSEVILGGGNFMPTPSLIIKKEVVESIPDDFLLDAPVGDFFIQIFGSINGGALFINKCMAIYRRGHIESWSMEDKDFKNIKRWREKYIAGLKRLNEETSYKYSQEIRNSLTSINYQVLRAQIVPLEYKVNLYNDVKKSLSISKFFLWHTVLSKPKIYNFFKKIKNIM